jgi:aryl-alcohol dehydrogenase-like predicted oxidoreductase
MIAARKIEEGYLMEQRALGDSDLRIAPIVFGAWAAGGWYWGGSDDDAAIPAMRRSIDLGMACIDTAPMYGCGRSEEVVGRAIEGRRDEVVIATKCGLRWDLEQGDFFFEDAHPGTGTPMRVFRNLRGASIIEECERSLRRLRTDRIDLYQCHWPDPTTDLDETMDALLRLKQDGKIRAIGVSNFTPEMIARCQRRHPIASNQPKYSLLAREIERDVLPWCHEHRVGSIVYSPIEQGLLTGKVGMDRTFSESDYRGDRPWFQMQNRRRVLDVLRDTVAPIANRHGATLGQVAIAWTIGEPGVTAAIVGARSPAQVEENAGALRFKLAAEERAAIRAAFEGLGEPLAA